MREGLEPTEEKEEPEFEVDHRTQGIVQDATSKDEDRMGNVKDVVDKLEIGYPPEEHPIGSTQRKAKRATSKAPLNCTNWDKYPKLSSAILAGSIYQKDCSSVNAARVSDLIQE